MKFKVTPHSIRPGVQVVEVRDDDGNLLATMTEGDHPRQIKVVSKYMRDFGHAPFKLPPIPALVIELAEDPVICLPEPSWSR